MGRSASGELVIHTPSASSQSNQPARPCPGGAAKVGNGIPALMVLAMAPWNRSSLTRSAT